MTGNPKRKRGVGQKSGHHGKKAIMPALELLRDPDGLIASRGNPKVFEAISVRLKSFVKEADRHFLPILHSEQTSNTMELKALHSAALQLAMQDKRNDGLREYILANLCNKDGNDDVRMVGFIEVLRSAWSGICRYRKQEEDASNGRQIDRDDMDDLDTTDSPAPEQGHTGSEECAGASARLKRRRVELEASRPSVGSSTRARDASQSLDASSFLPGYTARRRDERTPQFTSRLDLHGADDHLSRRDGQSMTPVAFPSPGSMWAATPSYSSRAFPAQYVQHSSPRPDLMDYERAEGDVSHSRGIPADSQHLAEDMSDRPPISIQLKLVKDRIIQMRQASFNYSPGPRPACYTNTAAEVIAWLTDRAELNGIYGPYIVRHEEQPSIEYIELKTVKDVAGELEHHTASAPPTTPLVLYGFPRGTTLSAYEGGQRIDTLLKRRHFDDEDFRQFRQSKSAQDIDGLSHRMSHSTIKDKALPRELRSLLSSSSVGDDDDVPDIGVLHHQAELGRRDNVPDTDLHHETERRSRAGSFETAHEEPPVDDQEPLSELELTCMKVVGVDWRPVEYFNAPSLKKDEPGSWSAAVAAIESMLRAVPAPQQSQGAQQQSRTITDTPTTTLTVLAITIKTVLDQTVIKNREEVTAARAAGDTTKHLPSEAPAGAKCPSGRRFDETMACLCQPDHPLANYNPPLGAVLVETSRDPAVVVKEIVELVEVAGYKKSFGGEFRCMAPDATFPPHTAPVPSDEAWIQANPHVSPPRIPAPKKEDLIHCMLGYCILAAKQQAKGVTPAIQIHCPDLSTSLDEAALTVKHTVLIHSTAANAYQLKDAIRFEIRPGSKERGSSSPLPSKLPCVHKKAIKKKGGDEAPEQPCWSNSCSPMKNKTTKVHNSDGEQVPGTSVQLLPVCAAHIESGSDVSSG